MTKRLVRQRVSTPRVAKKEELTLEQLNTVVKQAFNPLNPTPDYTYLVNAPLSSIAQTWQALLDNEEVLNALDKPGHRFTPDGVDGEFTGIITDTGDVWVKGPRYSNSNYNENEINFYVSGGMVELMGEASEHGLITKAAHNIAKVFDIPLQFAPTEWQFSDPFRSALGLARASEPDSVTTDERQALSQDLDQLSRQQYLQQLRDAIDQALDNGDEAAFQALSGEYKQLKQEGRRRRRRRWATLFTRRDKRGDAHV